MIRPRMLDEVIELAGVLEESWRPWLAELRDSGIPLCADDGGDGAAEAVPGDDGDDGHEGAGDDAKVEVPRAELDALRAEVAKARRDAKKAKADADRAAASRAKADGDLERLAEVERKRADEAEAKLQRIERQARISGAAKRTGFRYPDRAAAFLGDEVDLDDDASVERALKALKREEPDLFTGGRRSGGAIDGDPAAGSVRSMDDAIRSAAGYGRR